MENDTILNKSIFCALALFSFNSVTAMTPEGSGEIMGKVVVVGNYSKEYSENCSGDCSGDCSGKPALIRRMGGTCSNIGTVFTLPCNIDHRCWNTSIWDTASQKHRSNERKLYYRGANLAVLVSPINKANETDEFSSKTEELDYYFNEINNEMRTDECDEARREKEIKQRTIVLVEMGNVKDLANMEDAEIPSEMRERYNAIHRWCEDNGLENMDVSTLTGGNVNDACKMIGERLLKQRERHCSVETIDLASERQNDKCCF